MNDYNHDRVIGFGLALLFSLASWAVIILAVKAVL